MVSAFWLVLLPDRPVVFPDTSKTPIDKCALFLELAVSFARTSSDVTRFLFGSADGAKSAAVLVNTSSFAVQH